MTSSSLRSRIAGGLLVASFGTAVIVTACTTETLSNDRLCTPKAYVYCRCKDFTEGTKQCADDGKSFADCDCGFNGQINPGGGTTSFQPVDGGTAAGASIDEKCSGKIAVLAGSDESLDVYGVTYSGGGKWPIGVSTFPALRSAPRGGLVGNTLIAVWQSRFSTMCWTKFQAGQTSLTPPTTMGGFTLTPPDFVGGATKGSLYWPLSKGGDGPDAGIERTGDIAMSTYSPTGGWPDNDAIDPPLIPGTSVLKTSPSAVAFGNGTAIAFGTGDSFSQIAVQINDGTSWAAATTVAGAQNYSGQTPSLTVLGGGVEDLVVVYQGPDLHIHAASRKAGGAWNAPVLVDTAAIPNGAPVVTTMADGRAIAVWRGSDNTPAASVYTPASASGAGSWSNPTGVASTSPKLKTPPTVVAGRCASDATVTYVDGVGNVFLSFFKGGVWADPVQVPGVSGVTYAATGEVP